jgi:hypothetical protein
VRRRLAQTEGVDLVCWLEAPDGTPLARREMGLPVSASVVAAVEGGGRQLRFTPGRSVQDLRGAGWDLRGEPGVLAARLQAGRLRSEEYPDPLARVFSGLTSPHAGDFLVSLAPGYEAVDWGGASHAGGGSHGSLHRGDSLGPLLFVGCGPPSAAEREQWSLRDVAPIVLEHFGL